MRIPIFSDYDTRFQILFFGRMFASMGWAISMPFLAIFMSEDLGVNPAVVSLTYTVAALFGAVSQIIAGNLADRIGRRRTMLWSMGSRVFIFFAMTAAVEMNLGFIYLAILMVMSSVTGNTFYPAASAMITDIVPAHKRVEGFGLSRIGVNIGWALGPALGGVSAQFISFSATFLLTAIFSAATFFMILLKVSETCPTGSVEKFDVREILSIRKDRDFMVYNLFTIFASIIAMQMVSTLSMYSQRYTDLTEGELGGLFALNGALVVLLQFPLSRALSAYRLTTLLSVGSLLFCAGYFSVAFLTTFPLLLLAMTVITLGEIISSPPAMAIVGNMAPSNKRGQYMGVFGLFESLGGSFGPLIGGIAIATFPGAPLLIWAIPCVFGLVSVFGFLLLGRRLRKEVNYSEI